MTIELLSFLPLDGSAIIKREDSLFFIAPPYDKRNVQPVDRGVLERAILRFDFCVVEEYFESWESLIQFLDLKVREARQERGQDLSEIDIGREIIDSAPLEILHRFLDRIEHELLPSFQFEHAEAVILAMLESDNAMSSKTIRSRATALLRRLNQRRQEYLARRLEVPRNDSFFESLQKIGNMPQAQELTDAIAGRQSIWAFA